MSRWSKPATNEPSPLPWLDDPYFKLRPQPPTPQEEICSCRDDPPIKLMSLALLSENPIHCLRCNQEVPPERLRLDQSLVDAVAHWNRVYGAIDLLELDSGPYEAWARTQLLDPASPPNIEGLAVARKLNEIRRCYFWFFQPNADDDYESPALCPMCQESLRAYDEGLFPQLLCENDSIVLEGGYRRHDDDDEDRGAARS